MNGSGSPTTRMVDGKLTAFEPDGVTLLRHVKWAEGVADRDVPADGEPMEWQIPGQGFWDL